MRHLERSKGPVIRTRVLMMTSAVAMIAASAAITAPAFADEAAAKKWIDSEFQPSTLSKDDQMKEMQWFIKAAAPFKGMEINAVSETLTVHEYESKTLAKAFEEITGIKVKHDIIQEGDVVEKIQTQMQSGKNVYDGWINDSDFIGTHFRYGQAVDLTDYMAGEGKDVTDPQLDVNDFIGKSFTTAPNGHLYQLPDQQFANLYWFRYDWFSNPEYKSKFKAKYGYDLGVPVNWSAYEDIADFFTNDVKEINGTRVYGHMDYGKKDPSLGWRFTDAWLSMAGNGDRGIPNGLPVDEWGIRMEGCRPVGSSVERGGDVNGPASVYSIVKYLDWMKKYAPPQAQGMTFSESGPVPSQGNIAQQIFWYTAFTADMVKPGLPVMNADGTPKWRMAPSPHGSYWKDGMKQVVHRARAEARRADRVLPLAGARAVDPDRQQRAGLSEACATVVAEHRRCVVRFEDAAGGDGLAGSRAGLGDGTSGEIRRPGRLRTEDEQKGDG